MAHYLAHFNTTVGLSVKPSSLAIDQRCSLSKSNLPPFVQRYCHDIKARYIQRPVLPESDWPPSLGGKYIRLALIKQGRTTCDFRYHAVVELQEDYVRGKYDKILERKTEILLEEIFSPMFCEGGIEIPIRMLIDGAPGVGKTTLTREISQKWAKDELLKEYWLVLLLHLRERDISEAKAIDDFFYHDDTDLQHAMIKFVRERSGSGVLLIFDGFDELSFIERSEKSLFLDIIKGKILSECAVVVTSRPHASRPVQELRSVNRHIEVLGFTDEQVKVCIREQISEENKAEELCNALKDRLDIASLCQIPLNCSIVLFVYEQEYYRLPDTLTELYELFILHTLKRYTKRTQRSRVADELQNLNDLPNSTCNYFEALSKIAFVGLKEDRLVFSRRNTTVQSAFTLESNMDIPVLDLMTSAKSYSSRGAEDTYSFLHLTIQEYLAAFWAAHHLGDQKGNFFQKYLMNDRFYMVLLFFSGITKLDFLNKSSITAFSRSWEKDMIHVCHMLYESGNHSHCHDVATHCIPNKEIIIELNEFNRRRRGLEYHSITKKQCSQFETLLVANFIVHSASQWKSLTLGPEQVRVFHKVLKTTITKPFNIETVVLNVHNENSNSFVPCNTTLLNEVTEFGSVIAEVDLFVNSTKNQRKFAGFRNNLKEVLVDTRVIKSLSLLITGSHRDDIIPDLYKSLAEGLAQNGSVNLLKIPSSLNRDFMCLIIQLSSWNSSLKLSTLQVFKGNVNFNRENTSISSYDLCSTFAKFLSTNTSLKQIDIALPVRVSYFLEHYELIKSGLDRNFTLQQLTICKKVFYDRNNEISPISTPQAECDSESTNEKTTSDLQSQPQTSKLCHTISDPHTDSESPLPTKNSAICLQPTELKLSSWSMALDQLTDYGVSSLSPSPPPSVFNKRLDASAVSVNNWHQFFSNKESSNMQQKMIHSPQAQNSISCQSKFIQPHNVCDIRSSPTPHKHHLQHLQLSPDFRPSSSQQQTQPHHHLSEPHSCATVYQPHYEASASPLPKRSKLDLNTEHHRSPPYTVLPRRISPTQSHYVNANSHFLPSPDVQTVHPAMLQPNPFQDVLQLQPSTNYRFEQQGYHRVLPHHCCHRFCFPLMAYHQGNNIQSTSQMPLQHYWPLTLHNSATQHSTWLGCQQQHHVPPVITSESHPSRSTPSLLPYPCICSQHQPVTSNSN